MILAEISKEWVEAQIRSRVENGSTEIVKNQSLGQAVQGRQRVLQVGQNRRQSLERDQLGDEIA